MRVGRERMPAALAADHRVARGPAAVRAEMDAAVERRAAAAVRRDPGPAGRGGLDEGVELEDPLLERHELRALLEHELLAVVVAAVHLQHQPAEVADALLPGLQERAPLAAEGTRRGRRAPGRRRPSLRQALRERVVVAVAANA